MRTLLIIMCETLNLIGWNLLLDLFQYNFCIKEKSPAILHETGLSFVWYVFRIFRKIKLSNKLRRVGRGSFTPSLSRNRTWQSPVIRLFQIGSTGKAIRPMNKCVRIPFYHPFQPAVGFSIRPEFVALPRPFGKSDVQWPEHPLQLWYTVSPIVMNPAPYHRCQCGGYLLDIPGYPILNRHFLQLSGNLLPALTTYGRSEPPELFSVRFCTKSGFEGEATSL